MQTLTEQLPDVALGYVRAETAEKFLIPADTVVPTFNPFSVINHEYPAAYSIGYDKTLTVDVPTFLNMSDDVGGMACRPLSPETPLVL